MKQKYVTIADYRERARRRLPRILFDWIDGGAGDEGGLQENERIFEDYRFLPRYLIDVRERSQRKTLFGRDYASPFGISATGYAGLFRPNADLILAETAQRMKLPFQMSGCSVSSMEDAARVAPDATWYQLYAAADRDITADLIRRADDAGCQALVVTVDIPVGAPRERDIRNGFEFPPKLTPRILLDGMKHPAWAFDYLRTGGMPVMENWAPYAPAGSNAVQVAEFSNAHSFAAQTWKDLEDVRAQWPRKLIVKGVMHPEDARRAVELGADGIIVSNHGGRQFDRSVVAPVLLPHLRRTLGPDFPLMMDGGIRRGADIFTALCLGADFVFTGRAPLLGVAAEGAHGAEGALRILQQELDLVMGQIGCLDLDPRRLGDFLVRADGSPAVPPTRHGADSGASTAPDIGSPRRAALS